MRFVLQAAQQSNLHDAIVMSFELSSHIRNFHRCLQSFSNAMYMSRDNKKKSSSSNVASLDYAPCELYILYPILVCRSRPRYSSTYVLQCLASLYTNANEEGLNNKVSLRFRSTTFRPSKVFIFPHSKPNHQLRGWSPHPPPHLEWLLGTTTESAHNNRNIERFFDSHNIRNGH